MILAPSILSADFSKLHSELEEMESFGAQWFHIDVMDGHFVPNMTIGPVVVSSIRSRTQATLDCHLMVNEPEKMIPWFLRAGADLITFHQEAAADPAALISQIQASGKRAGVSIRPNTPVDLLKPYLGKLDLVLVMSVEPGFGGQGFMPEMLKKVEWLTVAKRAGEFKGLIEIDGGMNAVTARAARAAGVEVFVAGSALFGAKDRKKAYQDLQEAIR